MCKELSFVVEDSDPLVTIAIPTWNRPAELQRLLPLVLEQSYKHLEILISDNCSTDPNVRLICERAARQDKRVVYYRQTSNRGGFWNISFLFMVFDSNAN